MLKQDSRRTSEEKSGASQQKPDKERVRYFNHAADKIAKPLIGTTFHFGQIGGFDSADVKILSFNDRTQACNLPNHNQSFTIVMNVRRIQEDLNPGEKPGTRVWEGLLFIEGKYDKDNKFQKCSVKLYPGKWPDTRFDHAIEFKANDKQIEKLFVKPAENTWSNLMKKVPTSKNK